ncbi:MAG: OmpH/Skp family outer membrane protein [Limisphaerales bacterium]
MKTSLAKTLFVVTALLAATLPVSAQTKTATINLKKVFDSYWKTRQADAQIRDQAGDLDKQKQEMLDGYKKAAKEYQKLLDDANDQAVSPDEREKRKKAAESKLREIRDLEAQVQQFDQQARTQLAERQRRMREKILGEITKVVKADATQAGYVLVIDTAAESKDFTPVVVYSANGENDLTDKVLTELNANAPADVPKPAEDKGSPDDKKGDKKDEKKNGDK